MPAKNDTPLYTAKLWTLRGREFHTETVYVWSVDANARTAEISLTLTTPRRTAISEHLTSFDAYSTPSDAR